MGQIEQNAIVATIDRHGTRGILYGFIRDLWVSSHFAKQPIPITRFDLIFAFPSLSLSLFLSFSTLLSQKLKLLVSTIDFRYITDAITPAEAVVILKAGQHEKQQRIGELLATGYPCYTTQVGMLQ